MEEIWNNLTAELNSIGPPVFSVADWKRKWTVRKSNLKKRSRSSDGVGCSGNSIHCRFQVFKANRISILYQGFVQAVDEQPLQLHSVQPEESVDVYQRILQKLDEISKKQDISMSYQQAIAKNLDLLNNLLMRKWFSLKDFLYFSLEILILINSSRSIQNYYFTVLINWLHTFGSTKNRKVWEKLQLEKIDPKTPLITKS